MFKRERVSGNREFYTTHVTLQANNVLYRNYFLDVHYDGVFVFAVFSLCEVVYGMNLKLIKFIFHFDGLMKILKILDHHHLGKIVS